MSTLLIYQKCAELLMDEVPGATCQARLAHDGSKLIFAMTSNKQYKITMFSDMDVVKIHKGTEDQTRRIQGIKNEPANKKFYALYKILIELEKEG